MRQPTKDNESEEPEEWVFIFPSVMKCRLWYASLIKLKQHFIKNQDKYEKFQEYMANFDADIRKSLPQSSNSAVPAVRRSAPNLPPSSAHAAKGTLPITQKKVQKSTSWIRTQAFLRSRKRPSSTTMTQLPKTRQSN